MLKKILGVLLVVCTLITSVYLIGSASMVDADGLLTIDSTKAASGYGWSWDGTTLTLSQGEVKAIEVTNNIAVKIVLTEDVTIDARGLDKWYAIDAYASNLDINTGVYKLTILNDGDNNGIWASDGVISGRFDIRTTGTGDAFYLNGVNTIENAIITTNGQISGYDLTIKNSKVVADNSSQDCGHGIYAQKLVINSSIVEATSAQDIYIDAAIAGYSVYIENSKVVANGSVFGINVYDTPKNNPLGDTKLTIVNSDVEANGSTAALSVAYSYSQYHVSGNMFTGKKDTGLLSWSSVSFTTPTSTTKKLCNAKDPDRTTFYFVSMATSATAPAKQVITKASDASLLPTESQFVVVTPSAPSETTTQASSATQTTTQAATQTTTKAPVINNETVSGNNTLNVTASSIYGASYTYRKNTTASRWTKITESSTSTFGGVIANYDVYGTVMADLQAKYPASAGYTISNVSIVANAKVSVTATKSSAFYSVTVYSISSAQATQATAYKSTMSKSAFSFKNSKSGSGTISVPAVSAANPYFVVYAVSPSSTIALYAPTMSLEYSYTAVVTRQVADEETTTTTTAPTTTTTKATTTTKKLGFGSWWPWW